MDANTRKQIATARQKDTRFKFHPSEPKGQLPPSVTLTRTAECQDF